jgi:hypothetical protein
MIVRINWLNKKILDRESYGGIFVGSLRMGVLLISAKQILLERRNIEADWLY